MPELKPDSAIDRTAAASADQDAIRLSLRRLARLIVAVEERLGSTQESARANQPAALDSESPASPP